MQPMQLTTEPLTDDELDFLGDFLAGVNHGNAMTVEELDGFFCALICGPELILPSEYLPYVWDGDLIQGRDFQTLEEFQDIIALLTRHWNTIAGTLYNGEVYVPLLFENEQSEAPANEWAIGFSQGMMVRTGSWNKLLDDEDSAGMLLPVMILTHEHDPDPELRPPVITPEKRELLLEVLAATPLFTYHYFREQRGKPPRRSAKRRRGKR